MEERIGLFNEVLVGKNKVEGGRSGHNTLKGMF